MNVPGEVPAVLYEDEHLLVVNKPAGVNTHAPAPYAGEGIYDWLRNREPRWARLAIVHRLDKETSGVMVFGKSTLANRSLTQQFTEKSVRKTYLLLTDRPVPKKDLSIKTGMVRAGERYVARPAHLGAEAAETRFRLLDQEPPVAEFARGNVRAVEAEPVTGRTHQIRVHAAELGFAILGDTLYGGTTAPRVYLHARTISFKHPADDRPVTFSAAPQFEADRRLALRAALIDPAASNAFRLVQGASDGCAGWFVDRLGDFLLAQGEASTGAKQKEDWTRLLDSFSARGLYYKPLSRHPGAASTSPSHLGGEIAPERFCVRENGLRFELSFSEGYSVGLFLDQRDNRRRLMTGYVAPGFELAGHASGISVLNTFAYTCGFSVCAARAGARTTSIDLSKKYLDWGKINFQLNDLDPGAHEFLFGDVFDWLRRLDKKERRFEIILLDPPTFSHSKSGGSFRVEKDYGKLASAALKLLKPGGVLFASTNAAGWAPENHLAVLQDSVNASGRRIGKTHFAPQPPDFPVSQTQPAYLKTFWIQIED